MDGSQIEKIPIRKQYPAIDVARLLMAFCVVAIHISPFQDISASLNFWTHDWIVRIAVPFFFTASGFFLFRKMRDGCHVSDLRRYWLRILRVYIIWSIFYLPLIYETVLQDPDGVFHGAMIKMRDFFFFAPYVHLWFLRALLVAVPLVFFCFLRKQSFKKIFGFFGCAYVVALLFTCYRPIYFAMIAQDSMLATFVSFYDSIFSMPPTGICVGALFVSIGAYIALEPRMISQRGSLIGLLLSLLLFWGEGRIVHRFVGVALYDEYILLPFVSFFLFSLLCQIDLHPNSVYVNLRKLSALVFYAHMFFVYLVRHLQESHMIPASSLVAFFLTVGFSLLFSEIIIYLSTYSRFRFFRYLF